MKIFYLLFVVHLYVVKLVVLFNLQIKYFRDLMCNGDYHARLDV